MLLKYPNYKDSGVEWIGEIPEGWEVKKLKYVIKVNSGEGIKSDEITPYATYPVFGGNGIMGYVEKFNSTDEVIVIGRVGEKCGNVRLVTGLKYISDNALIAVVYKFYNIKYVAMLLQSMNLNTMANQNAQPLITGTMIKEKEFVFPPLLEQTAIASFLQCKTAELDQLIANKEKLVALYEEEKTSIMNRAVTKGVDPDVKLKLDVQVFRSSEFWQIALQWRLARMYALASFMTA